jgi:dihydrolipoamide dehydrogenase
MMASARAIFESRHAEELGLDIPQILPRWSRILAHKDEVVETLRSRMKHDLGQSPIDFYHGPAIARSPNDVRVQLPGNEERLITRNLVLATGAKPIELTRLPFDGHTVLTSDQALGLDTMPPRLVVVGGGYIGCEIACIYAMVGSQVTLVEAKPQLLPHFDPWVGTTLQTHLEDLGVTVITDTPVTGVIKHDMIPMVSLADQRTLPAEKILVAAGRQPVCDRSTRRALSLSPLGQAIAVDAALQTNTPNVYALGDVVGHSFLAHGATVEAEIAATNLTGGPGSLLTDTAIPKVVYTIPEILSVGATLAVCREQDIPVTVGQAEFRDNERAHIQRRTAGQVQMLVDAKYRVLGMTLIGPGVSEMAALAGTLLHRPEPFANLIIPFPSYATALVNAWEHACQQIPHIPE